MMHVILWKWNQHLHRSTYTAQHVDIVAGMVRKHLAQEVRICCVTDDPAGIERADTFPLWEDHNDLPNITGKQLPSCYRRLKLFDQATQTALGIKQGERIISLDLDSIIIGPLDDVITRIDNSGKAYAGWSKRGTYHMQVFNGSFFSMRAGPLLQPVWSDFDAGKSPRMCLSKGFLGSDQGWLSYLFHASPLAMPIKSPEFASYPQEVRRNRVLDRRTRIVFFHGSRKPWHRQEAKEHPWIPEHWRL